MNAYSNSDIMPESGAGIIEEPVYNVIGYEVHEIFWIDCSDGSDSGAIKCFEILGEFQDLPSARTFYNKNKIGIRDIVLLEIQQYPDGHLEYARIGGIA